MPTYEPFDWYETPLYYDIIFDADTDREVDFLIAAQERYGLTRGRRALEPACGSGRLVAALARRGYNVSGFDLSPGMLRFARQRLSNQNLRGSVRKARMEAFTYRPQFDLAHCLVSTFKYLPTEKDARNHLRCIAKALKPGGIYVLGLHLSEYDIDASDTERWSATRDGVQVKCTIQGWPPDRETRTERVRSRMTVMRNNTTRRYESNWTFRTYDLFELQDLLDSVRDLEHVATHTFEYDIDAPVPFDGEYLDNLLILRRR